MIVKKVIGGKKDFFAPDSLFLFILQIRFKLETACKLIFCLGHYRMTRVSFNMCMYNARV